MMRTRIAVVSSGAVGYGDRACFAAKLYIGHVEAQRGKIKTYARHGQEHDSGLRGNKDKIK